MTYAVLRCPACRNPWAVDLRNATATCPACSRKADTRTQARLWEGDLPQDAQQAASSLRLARHGVPTEASQVVQALAERPARAVPRHDSPVDAAAAAGAGIRNLSERAEAVAAALTKLRGWAGHDDLLSALSKAGLDGARAAAEVHRMLAADRMMEPRPGRYRFLEGA
ncbi:MAG: hypothetical protein LC620_01970 [Halobacteriales archaeon]|nr:hypothetical protein [Halobacteriales archaeon]